MEISCTIYLMVICYEALKMFRVDAFLAIMSRRGDMSSAFALIFFFNPYTMKQVGKKKSIGLISLVCLNLPPDIHYKPENMFLVGIVPGPNEPPLNTLNHYLRPLVDDLEQFWTPGVCFSHTSLFELRHLIRCALSGVVCDLLVAKKIARFAAFSHEHFCSICHCRWSCEGYGDTQYNTWRWWTNKECCRYAECHCQAEDAIDAQSYFDEADGRNFSGFPTLTLWSLLSSTQCTIYFPGSSSNILATS